MTVIYPSDRKLHREGGKLRLLEREEFFRAVDCVFDPRTRVELRDGIVSATRWESAGLTYL